MRGAEAQPGLPLARTALVAALYATLLVPVIVTPWLYFPYVTGKALLFRPLVVVLLGGVVALRLADGRPVLPPVSRWTPVTRAGAVYVAVLAASTAVAVDPSRSLWSTLERMEGLVGILHLAAFYVVLGAVLTTRGAWERWVRAAIGVSVVVSLAAWWTGGARFGGTLGGPTFLAAWLVLHAVAAAWQWARSPHQLVWAAVLALQLATLYRTGTRAAVVALAAAATVAALRSPRRRLLGGGLALAIGISLAARFSSFDLNTLPARLASTSSHEVRWTVWRIAAAGVRERPVLGWGLDGYSLVYARHYLPARAMPPWADRAHDGPLDQLIAAGVLGLVAWLGLLATAAVVAGRARHLAPIDRTALLALLAAWFAGGLFGFDDLAGSLAFVALLAGIAAGDRPVPARTATPPTPRRGLAALALAGSVAVAAHGDVGPLRAARALAVASDPGTPAVERLDRLVEAFAHDDTLLVGEALADATSRWVSPSEPAHRAYVAVGTAELTRIAHASPYDARAWLLLGSFLSDVGQLDAARTALAEARTLAPRMPAVLVAVAVAELRGHDPGAALEAARAAHDADRTGESALIAYVASLVLTGDVDSATALLRERGRRRPRLRLDPRVVGAWLAVDRRDVLLDLWREEVERNPRFKARLATWAAHQRGVELADAAP